jgi:hypothetical protein
MNSIENTYNNPPTNAALTNTQPQPISKGQLNTWSKPQLMQAQPTALPPCNTSCNVTLTQQSPLLPVYTEHSFPRLQQELNAAIAKAELRNSKGSFLHIQAVCQLPSKDLVITMFTKEAASRLHEDTCWLTFMDGEVAKLTIKHPVFTVIIHCIPCSFDPKGPMALEELKSNNPGILDSAHQIVWANEKKAWAMGKLNSSVIVHLSDPLQANKAITQGVVFDGTIHLVQKSH